MNSFFFNNFFKIFIYKIIRENIFTIKKNYFFFFKCFNFGQTKFCVCVSNITNQYIHNNLIVEFKAIRSAFFLKYIYLQESKLKKNLSYDKIIKSQQKVIDKLSKQIINYQKIINNQNQEIQKLKR